MPKIELHRNLRFIKICKAYPKNRWLLPFNFAFCAIILKGKTSEVKKKKMEKHRMQKCKSTREGKMSGKIVGDREINMENCI